MPSTPSTDTKDPHASALPVWLPATVFALAALFAVLPLILHGVSCGHDFDFHLLNWMEAASQWRHGIVKPVWAFTPAFNAGEPRLLLYPPLSWATGGVLGLILPWKAVPAAFTWLVLFLGGLTMHRLLRRWVSPGVAVLGGCLYMVNPYMLFVAYERTAYAELMAAAWMPLLLAAMLRPRVTAWRVAVAVALLWLTNAPSAVVGCYSVLLLGMGRLLLMRGCSWPQRLRLAWTVASGVLLGLLLDAFYLVPMGWERRFVQLDLAIVPIARPDRNFLFAVDKDGYHTHVTMQASWIAVATCTVAILCGALLLFWQRRGVRTFHSMRERTLAAEPSFSGRAATAGLLGFSVVVLFLLSRWSAPVWHVGPELVFLQFPWRFLTVQSAAAVALLAMVLQHSGILRRGWVPLSVALLLPLLAGYFAGGLYFREECADDESIAAQLEQFVEQYGVGFTDEYTPNGADNDRLPVHLPPAWIAADAEEDPGKDPVLPQIDSPHLDDTHFTTAASPSPSFLMVRLRKFPGWHTLRDGVEVDPGMLPDGVLFVPLSAGQAHHVEVRYRTTSDQWAGLGVSGAALLGCMLAVRRRRSGIMGPPA